jgi:large subunit ribosomal protein L3
MTKGILGRKLGMTQVFTPEGNVIPVTVIEAGPCVVLQKKDLENDGYEAIQLGFADKKEKNAVKPEIGHAKKAGTAPKRYVREIRGVDLAAYEVGQEIKADIFAEGEFVDVTGVSKGKGFQGVIKRHNQSRGPMAHGSKYHRGPGSMGSIAANRVFKGKHLPGHMGHETVTLQNLQVVKVDAERNVILVKGSIPGPKNSYVKIRASVKKQG